MSTDTPSDTSNQLLKENAQLRAELQQARTEMQALDALKDEFVSIASHELRTPMTAIQSYIWMTLQGKGGDLTDKQRYYLQRAYDSTQRLIMLVNDLLNVSRIESGRMEIQFGKVNLAELYTAIIEEVTPRAQELKLSLELELVNDDEPLVAADRDKIHEVLLNLIGNSFKFTPAGGTISIRVEKVDGEINTAVTDTGVGMDQEMVSNLFKKFGFMEDSYRSTHETEQGAGLGLYICKLIVDLHHGQISATSPGKDKGTTVTFSLPAYTPERLAELKQHQETRSGIDIIHYSI